MHTVKIGGVPEHFNFPWHLAIENGDFKNEGIALQWNDFYGGTGSLNKALRNKEIDMAIVLTEGIIRDIINGNPSKIVQVYVESPLLWGIHVASDSNYKTINDLKNKTVAISKPGSGSQLMAIVNAKNNGWNTEDLKFKIVENLTGGIKELTNHTADYFMWEHFTTKPLVDNGTFRRIADCPTPWPCFVIAVRNEMLEKHPETIQKVLKVINKRLKTFKKSIKTDNIDILLSDRYQQKLNDIRDWLSITKWNSGKPISKDLINSIQNKMLSLNVIKHKIDTSFIIKD